MCNVFTPFISFLFLSCKPKARSKKQPHSLSSDEHSSFRFSERRKKKINGQRTSTHRWLVELPFFIKLLTRREGFDARGNLNILSALKISAAHSSRRLQIVAALRCSFLEPVPRWFSSGINIKKLGQLPRSLGSFTRCFIYFCFSPAALGRVAPFLGSSGLPLHFAFEQARVAAQCPRLVKRAL